MVDVGQILYLAHKTNHSIPKMFHPYIPMCDLILGVQKYGLDGYLALEEASQHSTQVQNLYDGGASLYTTNKPTVEELKALISACVYDGVQGSKLAIPAKLKVMSALSQYLTTGALIEEATFNPFTETIDLEEDYIEFEGIFKKVVGKQPRGSLAVIAGDTKVGKSRTSIMLALNLLASGQIDRIVYVSLELTRRQVVKIFQQSKIHLTDKQKASIISITGRPSATMLSTELENMGILNSKTLVIYDSPDIYAQAGNTDPTSRYNEVINELKSITQNLALLVITSQVVRGTIGIPTVQQLSLSSVKAQYADFIVGIHRDPSSNVMTSACIANRNGELGEKVSYQMNYVDLTASEVVQTSGWY